MSEAPELKFLCDEQLGKLARWLRIIGQDCFYRNRLPDAELLEIAEKDSRLVLTRDHRLAGELQKRNVCYYMVYENYPALQLKEVVEEFQDRLRIRIFSRCADCNLALERVDKEEVRESLPPFVCETQQAFRRCPGCGKVFWAATHRKQVDFQLKEVLGGLFDKLREEVWTETERREQ